MSAVTAGRWSAVWVLAIAGCASTGETRSVPVAASANDATAAAVQPTVRLIVDPASPSGFAAKAQASIAASGMVASVVTDPELSRAVDFEVTASFTVRTQPPSDAELTWVGTDALLLTAYPSPCNRYRYSLNAMVRDASGRAVKAYSVEELETAWVWLFVGPKCNSPQGYSGAALADRIAAMSSTLVGRMQRDRVFDPNRAAALASERRPLVLVVAERASELIQQGLQLEDVPVQLAFQPASAPAPDYTLKVELSFHGGELVPGRALMTIWTLGLAGICSYRTAMLDSSVMDRDGQLIAHFQERDQWQPSMATGCALDDEKQRPEIVRALARRLSARLSTDGLAAAVAAQKAAPGAPGVRVVSNAMRPVVESITAARRPFARVSLDDAPHGSDDFVLDVSFRSGGGGSNSDPADGLGKSVAKAFVAGLTLGSVVPLCRPTTYTLVTQLVDRDGNAVWSDERSQTARTKSPRCLDSIDDRPEIAAALVDDMFKALVGDPRIPAGLTRAPDEARH